MGKIRSLTLNFLLSLVPGLAAAATATIPFLCIEVHANTDQGGEIMK